MYSLVMNKEFELFIKLCGGDMESSVALKCTTGLISNIRTGKREVSKAKAKLIIIQFPNISLTRLLYPDMDAA